MGHTVPAALGVQARRLTDILQLQVDAFEEIHADFEFDIERSRALQVIVRTLALLADFYKRIGNIDESSSLAAGDIVAFRGSIARKIDGLGEDGERGEMAREA